ncbi:MAG: Co/Zn/Cd efflux system component, partial [Paraglaciecola sp.]
MSECCGVDAQDKEQRTLLWTVLGLNGGMFFVEFIAGWLADSSGLMADSLDMLADAMVYMVGLYAVGKAIQYKAKAALFNGSLQLLLA